MSSRTLLVKGCRESFFLTTLCVCSYIVYIIVATAPLMLQDGPHSVRLQWDLPTPLGSTTGYKISYTGGSDGSGYVSGAQLTPTESHT